MAQIHWLSYTVKHSFEDSTSLLGAIYNILPECFVELLWGDSRQERLKNIEYFIEKGKNGYTESILFNYGIRILYNPFAKLFEVNGLTHSFTELRQEADRMGVHIIIPGSAFDRLIPAWSAEDCVALKERLKCYDWNISRIDIAFDTDQLDFSYFYEKYCKGEFITTYRSRSQFVDKCNRGTLYFGTRKSEHFIRIYDKALEKGLDGVVWTRLEGQYKSEYASQMFEAFILGNCSDYILGNLRFVKEVRKNMSRDSVIDDCYQRFISGKDLKRLSQVRKNKTVHWLFTQVGNSLKTLEAISPGFVNNLLQNSSVNFDLKKRLYKEREDQLLEVFSDIPDDINYIGLDKEVYEQLKIC